MRSARDLYPFLAQRWRDHLDTYGLRLPVPCHGSVAVSERPRRRCRAPMRGRRTVRRPAPTSISCARNCSTPTTWIAASCTCCGPSGMDQRNQELGSRDVPRHQRVAGRDLDRAGAPPEKARSWCRARMRRPRSPSSSTGRAIRDFVQVAMVTHSIEPLGRRRYWPIYEARRRQSCRSGSHVGLQRPCGHAAPAGRASTSRNTTRSRSRSRRWRRA